MALFDLKCPSLDYVYKMTWAEFQLRLIGFNKAEERDLFKVRRIAWSAFIGSHQDPRKLRGMSESKWMPIGEKKKIKVSEEHKQRFRNEYKKYLEKQQNGRA